MAPPTVNVAPSTHNAADTITLTGGPFGQAQGNGFVYVINDLAEVVEMVVGSWSDTSITVTYPETYAPLRTFTEQWGVLVDGERSAGKGTSTYQGVPPASASLDAGDPVYVAATEIRAEHQSFSRGYVLASESQGLYQVQLLKADLTFDTTVVDAANVSPMGRLSESYLRKQDRLPPYEDVVLWPSQLTLISNNNPSDDGESVMFTATVAWNPLEIVEPEPPAPTGNIEFSLDGDLLFTAALTPSGPTASVATFTTSSLPAGTNNITASFSSDNVYAAAFGSVNQVVNAAAQTTTTVVNTAPNPSNQGSGITVTATVSPQTSGTPTGNVNFTIGGVAYGSNPVALVNGVATISNLSSLAVGTTAIVASYVGATGYSASTSSSHNHVVNAVNQNTTTVLNTVPNPSNQGSPVDITATVTSGTGTPTGNVNFFFDGTPYDSNPVALSSGVATISGYENFVVGTTEITANYLGATGFNASSATAIDHEVTVANQNTTTVVNSSVNPSNIGQGTDITATVSPQTSGTPTGNVNFTIDGSPYVSNPVALVGGVATISGYSFGTGGTKAIVAQYLGGTGYNGSTSSSFNQGVRFNTSTVTSSTPNPSEANTGYNITATVTSSGGTPTGDVYFGVDGSTFPFGPYTLSGGVATWTLGNNTSGTEPGSALTFYSQYQGNATYNSSTSGQHSHTVKDLAGLQVSSNPTMQAGNDAPSGYNVTFTASFTTNGADPTGTVTFFNISNNQSYGTVPLVNGVAQVTTSNFNAGPNQVAVTYNGDALYSTEDVLVNIEIGTMDTTSTLSYVVTPNGPNYDIAITLTVLTDNSIPATGNAELRLGGSLIDDSSFPLNGSGQYTWNLINFNAANYDFRGDYLGNADFNASFDEDIQKAIP